MPENDPLLAPKVVADRLGMHVETLYRWMRLGLVNYVEVGPCAKTRRRKRIRTSELARLLTERRASVA